MTTDINGSKEPQGAEKSGADDHAKPGLPAWRTRKPAFEVKTVSYGAKDQPGEGGDEPPQLETGAEAKPGEATATQDEPVETKAAPAAAEAEAEASASEAAEAAAAEEEIEEEKAGDEAEGVAAPGGEAFSALGISEKLVKAIVTAGYTTPTPIQVQAVPHALQGKDVLGIAQTGTGKTASFTWPLIDILARGRARARMPRSLIIAPTRELADQVAENFDKYGIYHKLTRALLIGGVSFKEQDKLLSQGVDVLIATPGRLLDQFERGKILLNDIKVMVVDEADRMLDMGFIPDLEKIFSLVPAQRQTLFFSATMPPEITRLTENFLNDPVRVEVARQATTSETITQKALRIRSNDFKVKRAALRAAIDMADVANAIVFCNRKVDVDIVAKSLAKHGYDAAPIHGDLDQRTRMATLDRFRDGTLRFLVASDVAARGLDIPAVSHVFNMDVPHHPEDYVHRIGRTGRAGREGAAFTIVCPADDKVWPRVLSLIKKDVPEVAIEGFEESAVDREERGGRSGGRGRGRRDERKREEAPRGEEREERGARRERGERHERGDRPERVERHERGDRPERGERHERGDRPERGERHDRGDRPERGERPDRGPRRRGGRYDDDLGPAVKGFGEHVPAFILKAAAPRPDDEPVSSPKKSSSATRKAEDTDLSGEEGLEAAPAEKPKPKRTRRKPSTARAKAAQTDAETDAPVAGQAEPDGSGTASADQDAKTEDALA